MTEGELGNMKLGNEIICDVLKIVGFEIEEQEWPVYIFKLNEAIGLQLFTINKKMLPKQHLMKLIIILLFFLRMKHLQLYHQRK